MARSRYQSTQMGFPRFTGAVRNLVLFTAAVYVFILITRVLAPAIFQAVIVYGALTTEGIRHWYLWQFFTYGFLDLDPLNFLFSMLAVYFLGSAVEDRIRSRAFYELYISSLVLAGIAGFLLSLTHKIGYYPALVVGAGAAANGILMVFYLLYRDAPIMLFPLPIPIPVKYIVIFTAAVEGAYLFISHFGALYYVVLLCGLGAGYVWFTVLWRRSFFGSIQDWIASTRNNYYRWKRRRAARKFQVYMKKHHDEPVQYFDEYGNFKPPDERDKKKDKGKGQGPGGWVN